MKNVILLTIDTLRKDALGCYSGQKQSLTPFIDSIQGQCIRFRRSHSPGPYTQAGFPGILTSSYYLDYGYSKEKKFNPDRVLISEPLQRQGIVTAAFHSNAYLSGFFGWKRAWSQFYDSMEDEVSDKVPYIEGPTLNKKAGRWLSGQKSSGKPFFLWIHYMDVHEPYLPPRKYVEMVDSSIHLSEEEMFGLFKNVLLKRDVTSPQTVDLLKKLYLSGVRKVDDYVREFFGILRANDLLNETVIIITADHGDEFGEHGGLSHDGKMYSELVEVPLIIFDSSLPKQIESESLVSTVDIPPTILHLFGIEPISKFQGLSLLPLEAYRSGGVYGEAVDKYGEKERGDEVPIYYYRQEELKVIYRQRTDSWELYDLLKDPKEQHNIIGESPEAESMKGKLIPRVRRWEGKI
jgi:arylsulfatase A-like enzyme